MFPLQVPPLGVPSSVDPVGLVQCHLWCAIEGIVDGLNTEHEL